MITLHLDSRQRGHLENNLVDVELNLLDWSFLRNGSNAFEDLRSAIGGLDDGFQCFPYFRQVWTWFGEPVHIGPSIVRNGTNRLKELMRNGGGKLTHGHDTV